MAEDTDVVQPADGSVLDRLPMRAEDGEIRQQFVGYAGSNRFSGLEVRFFNSMNSSRVLSLVPRSGG